ncbi:hypothetical protein HER32_14290 [Hymenobacter sp. BT18]|uniref:hypothetical protein n=1 Tax=Hymenobacter sp. BT18 TaxID=2835648 RepID=UPI00143E3A2B|nr:hypothetical protein [Hymenobacter sp. BT18]QIX62283.1 hypothetical protein HER32_14290 [Hymenobacter sp. BT18]
MLFTKREVAAAKQTAHGFIKQCEEYRALLQEHELPLSMDINTLTGVLRAQQFAKLLAFDKGLKMRFEMLRTEEAQQKLIADTIDLTGYAIVDELPRRIEGLQRTYSGLMLTTGNRPAMLAREGYSLGQLLSQYGLDFNAWIEANAIDWTGKQHVLEFFRELAKPLTQLRTIYRKTRASDASLQHLVGPQIAGYFTDESNMGALEPHEHRLIQELIPQLQQLNLLAGFPGNLK